MTVQTALIPVLAAPLIDPASGRVDIHLPHGLSVYELLKAALPFLTVNDQQYCRIALVNQNGSIIVPRDRWHLVKPRPGTRVVIRLIPGKSVLRSVLSVVISIAAIALGAWVAGSVFGFAAGSAGYALTSGLVAMGVNVLGSLLINALVPPAKAPERLEAQNRYSISGWRNSLNLEGAVPDVLGKVRYAPPFAATSYTEIVGDWQYIRTLFNFGYGPLALSDFRIGETSLAEYKNVDIQVRDGRASDEPVTLYPGQIVEEVISAELTRPLPRDELGNVISGGAAIETPVVRTTGADATGASVIFAWPAGMIRYKDDGGTQNYTVVIRIQQRPVEANAWQTVTTLTVTARKLEAFYRQHTWTFPARGRWQVRCTMMTAETTSSQIQSRTSWAALQTIRPEYPLNFSSSPLALVAVRVKATHQLSGQLDNFTAIVSRLCLDYDLATDSWIERETSNPASLYRYVLQSAANPRPVSDVGIDLDALADWHNFCRVKGLTYNAVQDRTDTTLRDVLQEVAAAGRATPRHDGLKWTVTVDRPDGLLVDHINPRNSYDFTMTRTYVDPPHAFRIQFLDASNDYKVATRTVRWPGYEGPITLTEQLELPGKTDAAEVWREARRRMYEALHRPDAYQVMQDGPVRVATRGDHIAFSHDVLDRVQVAARVRSIRGWLIELDETVTMVAGNNYAIRFRVFEERPSWEAPDTIGTSIIRQVRFVEGDSNVLSLLEETDIPAVSEIVHFGPTSRQDFRMIVTSVEAGEDFSGLVRMIDAAPIIDQLTEADVPPTWSGRAGAELGMGAVEPSVPRFISISTGVAGTGNANRLEFMIEPGGGSVSAFAFEVEHRLASTEDWSLMTIPAATGGGVINDYTLGSTIELRARALSADGVPGPNTAVITVTIGSTDVGIPDPLSSAMITIGALLGGAVVQFATTADAATTQVQIYRSTSSVLNRSTDAVSAPIAVQPSRSYSVPVGDATRQNLLLNGGMDNTGTWTLGAGWSISAGVATHAAGNAGSIGQALATVAGRYYRVGFTVTSVTAGNITPRLTGGTDRNGTARATSGTFNDRIQSVTGNNAIDFLASASFSGSIDNVVAYEETATCLAQGTHYFWLEPQNTDGVPGPLAGPFSIAIR